MSKRIVLLLGLSLVLWLLCSANAGAVVPAPAFSLNPPAPGAAAAAPALAYAPGQLLVEFRAGETLTGIRATVREAGGAIVRNLPSVGAKPGRHLVLVESETLTTQALAASFAGDPSVLRTSPNYLRRIDAVPDDPGLIDQWGLFAVHAPQGWQTSGGSPDVVVADIDTGVDFTHPDLAANMWHNPGETPGNGIDDDGNGYVDDVYGIDTVNHDSVPLDDYGHGTHVAGIIAAVSDNGVGVAGVAPRTHIMALKFIGLFGWGDDADAIACIDYAVHEKLDHGVNVVAINASWGWTNFNPFLRDAIARAGDAGIVFCAAAGNNRGDNDHWPHYPSAYDIPSILAVAATGPSGGLAFFSNYGRHTVDLAAPGLDILSTLPNVLPSLYMVFSNHEPETGYASWSGTSMATPFVAGTVALLAAAHPEDSLDQRVARILSSADKARALRGTSVTGGRLDVAAALRGQPAPADVTPPQTDVVGRNDAWHDLPVRLKFVAVDGPDGSGVASTEWRLDGGAWEKGSKAVVPAPADTRRAFVVDFRSGDKAGNVEAIRSCVVNIDTGAPAHAEIPGTPLAASPVFGDLLGVKADRDVFQVHLEVGESLRAVMSGVPGSLFEMRLFPPGTLRLGWVPAAARSHQGDAGQTLLYTAEQTGTYYLDTRAYGAPSSYRLHWTVAPAGVDLTPPLVTADTSSFFAWYNRPVSLAFLADDGAFGSGVSALESSMDGGFDWTAGAHPVLPAPADHSKDGLRVVFYRARDRAGNVSRPGVGVIGIDTAGPTTETWGPAKPVRRGDRVRIRFRIYDLTGQVRAQLLVQSVATGETVATIDLRKREADSSLGPAGYKQGVRLACSWPRGTYRLLIAGTTHDAAGNLWASATCHRNLRIE